jgi:hypothetical protein
MIDKRDTPPLECIGNLILMHRSYSIDIGINTWLKFSSKGIGMNIFEFRDRLIGDYASYIESFIQIRAPHIHDFVERQLQEGMLWPDPLNQLNLGYSSKPSNSPTPPGNSNPLPKIVAIMVLPSVGTRREDFC